MIGGISIAFIENHFFPSIHQENLFPFVLLFGRSGYDADVRIEALVLFFRSHPALVG